MGSERIVLTSGEIMLKSERTDKIHAEGVALLLGRIVQKSLIYRKPYSPRILQASLQTCSKKIKRNIVVIYVPTNDAEEKIE